VITAARQVGTAGITHNRHGGRAGPMQAGTACGKTPRRERAAATVTRFVAGSHRRFVASLSRGTTQGVAALGGFRRSDRFYLHSRRGTSILVNLLRGLRRQQARAL